MKYTKLYLMFVCCGLVLLGCVQIKTAFDLVECMPLHSTNRQEARIDNNWLITEPTLSYLHGYLVIPYHPSYIDVFYEGHSITYEYYFVKARVFVTNTFYGPYGLHFTGKASELIMGRPDKTGYDVFNDVSVNGFYNPASTQIFINFIHDNFGMTWVTFMNQGVMRLSRTEMEVNK